MTEVRKRIEPPLDGENFTILPGNLNIPLVGICEHASNIVPPEYAQLGLSQQQLNSHWGWDPGAWAVLLRAASELKMSVVGTQYSRLLIDVNRAPRSRTLVRETMDGLSIPGNAHLSFEEIESRLLRYHQPYHDAVARVCEAYKSNHEQFLLLSFHSFSPDFGDQDRDFDLGLLFDERGRDHAEAMRVQFTEQGLSVRMNEPYSGMNEMIYSVARHGRDSGVPYLELEMNQGRIATEMQRRSFGDRLIAGIRQYTLSLYPQTQFQH